MYTMWRRNIEERERLRERKKTMIVKVIGEEGKIFTSGKKKILFPEIWSRLVGVIFRSGLRNVM